MKVSADVVRRTIEGLSLGLLEGGIAIDMNKAICLGQPEGKTLVTWASTGISTAFTDLPFATVGEYLELVSARQFTVLLLDGALLQISYTVQGGDVIGHRLCWYPCPGEIREEDLELASIEEIVSCAPIGDVKCRGPIRFDFKAGEGTDGHSPSHLHLSEAECRIPVRGPLDLATFSTFVLRNFYPDLWPTRRAFVNTPVWHPEVTISDEEALSPHLHWRTAI